MRILNHALKDFIAHHRKACFYFDLKEIDKNLAFLQSLATKQVQFIFPVKSFNHSEVVALAAKRLSGFDVSNALEMSLVQTFVTKNSILWSSSPTPWNAEGLDIFMDGPHSNANWSLDAKRSLRINLGASRFGIHLERASESKVCALHFHLGDENATQKSLVSAIKQIGTVVKKLSHITHVNCGGSFGSLQEQEIAALVSLASEELPNQQIIFEPGRWVARNAGVLIGKIEDINVIEGKGHVLTSLSRDCHLRWYKENFKMSFHSLGLSTEALCTDVVIGGATCHEADIIGVIKNGQMRVAVGDLLVLSDATGYSLAWNHSFNGVPAAEVVFVYQ